MPVANEGLVPDSLLKTVVIRNPGGDDCILGGEWVQVVIYHCPSIRQAGTL